LKTNIYDSSRLPLKLSDYFIGHLKTDWKLMNNAKFKLTYTKNNDQVCLQLNSRNQMIRKWYGAFAKLINEKIVAKYKNNKLDIHSTFLNKSQIHTFFTEITCLHQVVIYHFNIEKELSNIYQDKTVRNISESLLLQIRINNVHFSYDDLLDYFLNEFSQYDIYLFDKTINLLIKNKLIQSINTEDGYQYFDKNIQLHNHLYFKQHKKLVDCSKELTLFLSGINYIKKNTHTDTRIIYVNNLVSA
jgi:Fe2+ or Zn2+ uptake regulation protein